MSAFGGWGVLKVEIIVLLTPLRNFLWYYFPIKSLSLVFDQVSRVKLLGQVYKANRLDRKQNNFVIKLGLGFKNCCYFFLFVRMIYPGGLKNMWQTCKQGMKHTVPYFNLYQFQSLFERSKYSASLHSQQSFMLIKYDKFILPTNFFSADQQEHQY